MTGQPDTTKQENQPSREELDIRKGARVKPGGDEMHNAESEEPGNQQQPGQHPEGEEQHGSVKNSK